MTDELSDHVERGGEQYFNAQPTSDDVRRDLNVQLRGMDMTVSVSNGVFSSHRLDAGTAVLLRRAPLLPEEGNFLDIGCGWGPIVLSMASESPKANVWAIDVNDRAIDLARENATRNDLPNVHVGHASDVPADMTFDVIWSNPPIRVGKDVLHELLMTWLPRLQADGAAYLVVQKNLGSDSLITWLARELGDAYSVSKYASSKGYRLIEVRRLPEL